MHDFLLTENVKRCAILMFLNWTLKRATLKVKQGHCRLHDLNGKWGKCHKFKMYVWMLYRCDVDQCIKIVLLIPIAFI